jgi:hypothetical protein
MNKRGGKRIGAGRKKEQRTIESEKAREYMISRIAKELGPIVTAQIESAKGLYFEDKNKNLIYKIKPDLKAGEYLLNQIVGKYKETLAVTTSQELFSKEDRENSRKAINQFLNNLS